MYLPSNYIKVHFVYGYVTFGCFMAYLFVCLWICLSFCFLYLFFCFFISFLVVVFDSGFGLLMPLGNFYLIYCFLLKKLTLNTPNKDSMKDMLFPYLVDALNRILSSFVFYLYRANKGYYWSYSLVFSVMSFCLIYCFPFLLWTLANYGFHRTPLLKVILRTGESFPLRFFERALMISSGSGLAIWWIDYDVW